MTIINYANKTISGSIFTLSDLYLFLKNSQTQYNIKQEMIFFDLINKNDFLLSKNIFQALQNYTCTEFSIANKFKIFEDDIIITSTYVLFHVLPKLKCKKLIILDSLDYHIMVDNGTINFILEYYKNIDIIFLLNPFNFYYKEDKILLKKYLYFSKLSDIRLNLLNNSDDDRVLIRDKCLQNIYKKTFLYEDRYKFINTLQFRKFAFIRLQHMQGLYIENIGKMLFEFIFLGKEVDYYAANKIVDDGLHFYLEQLGIDDNIDNLDIKIEQKKLLNKVVFGKNDDIEVFFDKC